MPNAWVLVIGMHRSGTSAVTGMLHHLGLALPADLMAGGSDNPSHYESRSLTSANEAVLGLLGGSWDSPPVLVTGWEDRADMTAITETLATAATSAFPGPHGAVWKDPRSSLLLPLWSRAISPIAGVVLVWRDPVSVALSLEARDDMPIDRGLALWRRYNEDALANSVGHNLLVVCFDDVVDDPSAAAATMAQWLGRVVAGTAPDAAAISGVAGSVAPQLRHHRDREAPSDECGALAARLAELNGAHHPFRRHFEPAEARRRG